MAISRIREGGPFVWRRRCQLSAPDPDGVVFGRGAANPFTIGPNTVNFTRTQDGMPAVLFRRDGSASESGGFYIIPSRSIARGSAHEARACDIVRATGRVTWSRYLNGAWTRGGLMNRRGFTLIEIMVAMVILTIVVVGIGKIVGTFIHAAATSTTRTIATTVAIERLDLIRGDPTYPLPNSWSGTATGFPGYPNWCAGVSWHRSRSPSLPASTT